MTHGRYRVVGKREYRGHVPGAEFEAQIDRKAEARAVQRGDIILLERINPSVKPGTYRFPDGWLPPPEHDVPPPLTEAPKGAFSVPKGG